MKKRHEIKKNIQQGQVSKGLKVFKHSCKNHEIYCVKTSQIRKHSKSLNYKSKEHHKPLFNLKTKRLETISHRDTKVWLFLQQCNNFLLHVIVILTSEERESGGGEVGTLQTLAYILKIQKYYHSHTYLDL